VGCKDGVAAWKLAACGFEAIQAGLLKSYADGRKALHRAYETSRPKDFHEWRKRVKYHRYHLRLLRNLWPRVMRAWRREVVTLSELLGKEHDLAVKRARPGRIPGEAARPERRAWQRT
jgi:CHAD domain-containing protein